MKSPRFAKNIICMDLNEISTTEWDVIVVGTGMGGASLGYKLAKSGKKVLFCEKGKSHITESNSLNGRYAEQILSKPGTDRQSETDILMRAGRCWETIEDTSPPSEPSVEGEGTLGTGYQSPLPYRHEVRGRGKRIEHK